MFTILWNLFPSDPSIVKIVTEKENTNDFWKSKNTLPF